jgi:hypothetical protein
MDEGYIIDHGLLDLDSKIEFDEWASQTQISKWVYI